MIYEIKFAGKDYEIKCEPLTRRSFAHLGEILSKTKTKEDNDAYLVEFVKITKAAWRVATETQWHDDFNDIPQPVLDAWHVEMYKSEQVKVEIAVKQEKN